MDRYLLFQLLLTMLADDYEIENATLKDYSNRIVIEATCPDNDIKIEVTVTESAGNDADKT